jgi:ribose 5-phosphate isomerase B
VKLAIGADHAGFALKEDVRRGLEAAGHVVRDFGTDSAASVDYPDYALAVARSVQSGEAERGILICGTGIGMAISANRVRGVRAASCSDCYSARMARAHNDANVLAFGARVVGPGLAAELVRAFLETPFEGGRHQGRVHKIEKIEADRDRD